MTFSSLYSFWIGLVIEHTNYLQLVTDSCTASIPNMKKLFYLYIYCCLYFVEFIPFTPSSSCHVFLASLLHSSKPDSLKATSIADKEQQHQADPSMRVMHVADLASDRTWDLEIRSSIKSRQLVAYKELKEGWHWDGQEVLTADVGEIKLLSYMTNDLASLYHGF